MIKTLRRGKIFYETNYSHTHENQRIIKAQQHIFISYIEKAFSYKSNIIHLFSFQIFCSFTKDHFCGVLHFQRGVFLFWCKTQYIFAIGIHVG